MSVRGAALRQYQAIVDRAARQSDGLGPPPEGWLRTARKALGMTGADLARRMGVTRARITAAEQAELSGGITLRSMQAAAEAMGCRLVYAIVPASSAEDLITAQARRKARAIVDVASRHMALESQTLPEDKIAEAVDRTTADLIRDMPPGFWDDE
jgi:predicted DNA-binding mobile mystery protein A